NSSTVLALNQEKYLGKALLNKGKYAYAGYFEYQFFDSESNFLPFKVGTYLGTKKVLNIGTGFFLHPNGIVHNNTGTLEARNVSHIGVDAFYDAPLGHSGGALTA